ncbi:hypothetical protein [Vibrio superstes]|uniref:Uncharacterized protein n=1 Tax=Vibrio superstes NBRC 103154 TaxID=1219062 RepID=A0A511QV27_9VIBR|nr:hypothetical protein [Vibrio superstes]GEM81223.1 hypothetical protein VSU01S_34680 [Vibrio superstes NBRC 103154]
MFKVKSIAMAVCLLAPSAYALTSSDIDDERIVGIKNAVATQNGAFVAQNQGLKPVANQITSEVGEIINVALLTNNESRMLSNCSLNATGLATRQTTASVSDEAEDIMPNTGDHFWGQYAPTVEKQLVGISNYLSVKTEDMPFELATPLGSQWRALDQTKVQESLSWHEMNEYPNGTRFVVAIGLEEDLIRDNSHYIYAEKQQDQIIFIDGQTNLAKDIPPTYLYDQFDFAHLAIPSVTTMMFWALKPVDA